MVAIACNLDKIKCPKTIKKQVTGDIELIVQKRGYRYRAIIKYNKTNEMVFSNAYDTIAGLNRYFLASYNIKLM